MRVDMFAKRELMVLTCGEPSNLNGSVIEEICHRVHDQWVADARNDAKKQHKAEMKAQKEKAKNRACQQAEAEVELEFAAKEKSGVRGIKIACTVIAVAFILASYWSFAVNSEMLYRGLNTSASSLQSSPQYKALCHSLQKIIS